MPQSQEQIAAGELPPAARTLMRGVGRAAVHEFAHLLLGSGRVDDDDDPRSYEYGSAARREQYYGDMHWGRAWPALHNRFGARRKG